MEQPTHNALFTTASGVVGGVGKAITAKPLLLAITFPSLSALFFETQYRQSFTFLLMSSKKVEILNISKLNSPLYDKCLYRQA
jgi:hypothetical protein